MRQICGGSWSEVFENYRGDTRKLKSLDLEQYAIFGELKATGFNQTGIIQRMTEK
jgi:hypothetical protein